MTANQNYYLDRFIFPGRPFTSEMTALNGTVRTLFHEVRIPPTSPPPSLWWGSVGSGVKGPFQSQDNEGLDNDFPWVLEIDDR